MWINSYSCMLNDAGLPYMEKDKKYPVDGRRVFNMPESIARDFVMDGLKIQNMAEEYCYCICLDVRNRIKGCFEVSHGTMNASLVSPREVFMKALFLGAASIVVTHNHPSGDASPSEKDSKVTKALQKAGELLEVPLLDHIIVAGNDYFSYKENGLMD